jgi:phosphatidate cytidylyltransferase
MLRKRIITAIIGIPLLVAAIWFNAPLPWFTILVAIWGALAVFEFYRLGATAKLPLLTCLGIVWTALFIASPHCTYELAVPVLLTSAVVLSLICLLIRRQKEGAFTGWAWTMAGILYIGWLLSHWTALRGLDDGRNWVFFALLTTFASDTAAFFIGRAWGKHYLAPNISPGKTWEGAVGGLIGAMLVSLLFIPNTFLRLPFNGWWQAVLLGLAVSVFGQLGDLAESLLKRNAGVKDSGSLVPGHGGFLDRIDSVVFAGIVVYYYVVWMTQ